MMIFEYAEMDFIALGIIVWFLLKLEAFFVGQAWIEIDRLLLRPPSISVALRRSGVD